jgi:Family of unknown function (DUF6491)
MQRSSRLVCFVARLASSHFVSRAVDRMAANAGAQRSVFAQSWIGVRLFAPVCSTRDQTRRGIRRGIAQALVASLVVMALTACTTGAGLRDEQRLELYSSHAGAPVDSIRYPGTYIGWTPLGDSALALWTRPSEAYLLDLTASCNSLNFAHKIAIRSRSGFLTARFDDIYVDDNTGLIQVPCRIKSIRPLDVKAIRADEKQLREVRRQEAEPAAS